MKIMLITNNISGGLVHYTSQLANSLSKTESVTVVAPNGLDEKYFADSVRIKKMKMGNIKWNYLIDTMVFTRLLRFKDMIYKENPDIIHFQECPLWLVPLLPTLKKFPIITTKHDTQPHPGTRIFIQKFCKQIYNIYSNALIVHGENAKKDLNTKKECFVIPHGDYSFFLDYMDQKFTEENTVLFFGVIQKYKGLEYLIQSIPIIKKEIPHFKLIIAGSGNFTEYQNMIDDYEGIEIHNRYIKDEEIPVFFQRAKVVVLPYIEGTQTGIIPIAYAFKKPVVVTNVGSIPEVVDEGKTGFIVPPGDPKALAQAIIRLLNDESLCKQMGRSANIKMNNELSWNTIANKTISAYKLTIQNHYHN